MELQKIIFIHGLADVSKSWHRLKPFLESHGFQITFYDYATLKNNLDIPQITGGLASFIQKNIGDAPFQLLAHSQGGLIAEWFDFFHNANRQLKKITTIATPFHGNSMPLFARQILEHIPVSRKQIEGLSCFSPVLKTLIQKRLEIRADPTEYFCFIGYRKRLFKIEGDFVVAVCEANRHALYYEIAGSDILPIRSPRTVPFKILKKNHMPLNYVRHLSSDQNSFAADLITVLTGNMKEAGSMNGLSQCALVIPKNLEEKLKFPPGVKKIVSKTTADAHYRLIYAELTGPAESFADVGSHNLQLQAGHFSYLFDAALPDSHRGTNK